MALSATHGLSAFFTLLALGTRLVSVMGAFSGSLNADQKTAILNEHNRVRASRAKEQPCAASDMQKLSWDDALAASSQTWAEGCVGDHAADAGSQFGENLWMNIYQTEFTTAELVAGTFAWYDEVNDTVWDWNASAVRSKPLGQCPGRYDGTTSCNVGHYYQMIWAKASKVGCGVAVCEGNFREGINTWGNAVYLVCRYDVPAKHNSGATLGLPYQPGLPCAGCGGVGSSTCDSSMGSGLCLTPATRCVDSVTNCVQSLNVAPSSFCSGFALTLCQKTCGECTDVAGTGYPQCPGWDPSLVPTVTVGLAPCALPAVPLNAGWECKTDDGCRSVEAVDRGFFMYQVANDPNITCRAKCKAWSRGPLGITTAIRYSQPADRVGIASRCSSEGSTLDYTSKAPQSLVDADNYNTGFCLPIKECMLPTLNDANAIWDVTSCNISNSLPGDEGYAGSFRILHEQQCMIKCQPGYELDSRYGDRTKPCEGVSGILGSTPGFTSGTPYASSHWPGIQPGCVKIITSGFLGDGARDNCTAGGRDGAYTISAEYKNATNCLSACIEESAIQGWGTNGKQKIVEQCRIMTGYDGTYTPYRRKYCCCAKAECFGPTGAVKTATELAAPHPPADTTPSSPVVLANPSQVNALPESCLVNRVQTTTGGTTGGVTTGTTAGTTAGTTGGITVPITTTSTTPAPSRVVSGVAQLTLDSIPANFTTDPLVREALAEGIADTIPGVQPENVQNIQILVLRRLADAQLTMRRLNSTGAITVTYDIHLPSNYTGAPITVASISATTLKDNINTKLQSKGIAAQVTAVEVKSMVTAVVIADSTTSRSRGSASSALISASPGLLSALVMGVMWGLCMLQPGKFEL